MSMHTKKWLLAAVAAASMAAAGTASAIELTGSLDPTVVPPLGTVGLDVLALSFTPGDYVVSIVGPASPSLFTDPSNTFVNYTSSSGLGSLYTYLYSGLSGTYKLSLLGTAGAPYKISVFGTGTVAVVPEPESLALALGGLGVLGLLGRRRLTNASAQG
jgi:hypothetical protein